MSELTDWIKRFDAAFSVDTTLSDHVECIFAGFAREVDAASDSIPLIEFQTPSRDRLGLLRCESRIELSIAVSLAGRGRFDWRTLDDEPTLIGRWPNERVELHCQFPIGVYRVDFLLRFDHHHWLPQARKTSIIIEADGHEFHERTPEQAERDRSRDRELTTAGATVFRFTGREIMRDPDGCARQIWRYARSKRAADDKDLHHRASLAHHLLLKPDLIQENHSSRIVGSDYLRPSTIRQTEPVFDQGDGSTLDSSADE